jgi:hypothetical protein
MTPDPIVVQLSRNVQTIRYDWLAWTIVSPPLENVLRVFGSHLLSADPGTAASFAEGHGPELCG